MFKNIWLHPRTTFAGLLVGATTIAGVLSQQGVTLGHAGAGTGVALISGIAAALLGLLARDPAPASLPDLPSLKTPTVGVLALCMLLLMMPFVSGCSGVSVAQDIVNWTPALQSAVATVDSTAAILDPGAAPIFVAATLGFDAASNLLVSGAKAYLANPSASILAQLQTQIVTFQQQVNAALLSAAKIVNPASQQHALSVIQGVATIANAILAEVLSISSKAQAAALSAQAAVKVSMVARPETYGEAVAALSAHYAEPIPAAQQRVDRGYAVLLQAGF